MQRSMVAALVLLALAAPARAERQADRVIVHGDGLTFGVKEPPGWRADLGHAPRFGAHVLFYQTKHALRGGATLIMVRLSTSAANDAAQDLQSDMDDYRRRFGGGAVRDPQGSPPEDGCGAQELTAVGRLHEDLTFVRPG